MKYQFKAFVLHFPSQQESSGIYIGITHLDTYKKDSDRGGVGLLFARRQCWLPRRFSAAVGGSSVIAVVIPERFEFFFNRDSRLEHKIVDNQESAALCHLGNEIAEIFMDT